jgi:hypothetical protein
MASTNYELFPDPSEENKKIDESDIKDVFIVVYHTDGTEMMSFRKSFMDVKNINLEEMISLHPSNNFSAVEEENNNTALRKKYIGE